MEQLLREQVALTTVLGRRVRVRYGGRVGLDRSDFTLTAGTLTVLMGPNGAGKSTLLHALAGLVPAEGELLVLGQRPVQARRFVAYVQQSVMVNALMPVTVREAVTVGRYAHTGLLGRLRPRDREVVDAVLGRLGIAALARRHLTELSGGSAPARAGRPGAGAGGARAAARRAAHRARRRLPRAHPRRYRGGAGRGYDRGHGHARRA